MLRRVAVLAVLVMITLPAVATARSAKAVIREFRTPSGNIGCVFSSGLDEDEAPAMRCDIRSRLHPQPSRPANCPLNYGDSLQVTRVGKTILVCHGDTAIDPRARVLAYGHQFIRNGITCVSRSIGLTCTNTSGHGFFLSRGSWRIF